MISDVLAEAVAEIDRYLTDPMYADIYGEQGYTFLRLVELVDEMDTIRSVLDDPVHRPPQSDDEWGEAVARYRLARRGDLRHAPVVDRILRASRSDRGGR